MQPLAEARESTDHDAKIARKRKKLERAAQKAKAAAAAVERQASAKEESPTNRTSAPGIAVMVAAPLATPLAIPVANPLARRVPKKVDRFIAEWAIDHKTSSRLRALDPHEQCCIIALPLETGDPSAEIFARVAECEKSGGLGAPG